MILWNSVQEVAADRGPCATFLSLALAISLVSASPNARDMAVLNSVHVVFLLYPLSMDGSIQLQALLLHLPLALLTLLSSLVPFTVELELALGKECS